MISFFLPLAMAGEMSVNVSMPGAINPFEGYRMTYTDKEKNSCTFVFSQPGDGFSYLKSDKKCPSFVTEDKVFLDAQEARSHMEIVSHARTFSEYFGEDKYGNKIAKASLYYRCANSGDVSPSQPMDWVGDNRNSSSGYMFMPVRDTRMAGWYRLDYYPDGYKPYQFTVGVWKPVGIDSIVAVDRGRNFTISEFKIRECYSHPID